MFIKKAPAVTIRDLTQAIINIFGAKNKVEIIGTRAGEKVHETLATQMELVRAEDLGDYFRINNEASQSYDQFYSTGVAKEIDGTPKT